MHIFVINLEKDRARRESIQKQLEDLHLPFEFVPGVHGAALSPAELAKCYNDKKARRNLCMPLVPAHIGCSLGHNRAYEKLVERNLPCALILEDDVIFPETTPDVIGEIEKVVNVNRPEVILLSSATGKQNGRARKLQVGGHQILDYEDGFLASACVVTNLAARALLKELSPVWEVADCWPRLHSYKVVDLFVVAPPLIEQDQITFGSSTNEDIRKFLSQRSMLDKFVFKFRRAWSKGLDFFYAIYRRTFVPYAGIKIPPSK